MKFANYYFRARGVNNLGDNMQVIAIDAIYENMGIARKDIIYIDKNDLSTYAGEYVVLPVTMPLVDYVEGGISQRFSSQIIPVFIGLVLVQDYLLPEEVLYYQKFEPIGCRDERTMNTLRSYGVHAYLHGCITATLPTRAISNKVYDKVFMIDVQQEILPHIPEDLLKFAESRTHFHENLAIDPKNLMQQYYDDYKNQAKLIITSLLHCAVPCMAAGIPVILTKKEVSFRFGWLEKLLPMSDVSKIQEINWYPESVSYAEHKSRLLQVTINRINETFNKYQPILDISWFYEQREKSIYYVDGFGTIQKFIDEKFIDYEAIYEYAIWGLTQASSVTVSYIRHRYPNAKLMHVYDAFREVTFEGLRSESPENIRLHPEEFVFVTTNGAESSAARLFAEIGKSDNSYAFMKVVR